MMLTMMTMTGERLQTFQHETQRTFFITSRIRAKKARHIAAASHQSLLENSSSASQHRAAGTCSSPPCLTGATLFPQFFVFLYFFFFFINPLSLCRSLSDALMLGLLTEHNGSNPLLIRLSSSPSPSPLPRSSFLISSLLPLNLLVFPRISPPFHTVTEGWKKKNTSIPKKKCSCIFSLSDSPSPLLFSSFFFLYAFSQYAFFNYSQADDSAGLLLLSSQNIFFVLNEPKQLSGGRTKKRAVGEDKAAD